MDVIINDTLNSDYVFIIMFVMSNFNDILGKTTLKKTFVKWVVYRLLHV